MEHTRVLAPGQAARNAFLAYVGAITAQTGVQLVAPSLAAMRGALGLSDAQLALVMTVYLLPATLGALPAGILADRIGRRRVFGWSLVSLGIAGIALQFVTGSFGLFLAVRFLQGVAFSGLLPLTMTILGDSYGGADLVRAQGRRSVAMAIGDGGLPILGGMLAAVAWNLPWVGQILGIPLGLVVLARMTDPPAVARRSNRVPLAERLADLVRIDRVLALQYAGFLRMFLKFSILTYLPVMLVDEHDVSLAYAGIVVGAASVAGIAPSLAAGWLARLARPTTFLGVGLVAEAVALATWSMAGRPSIVLTAAIMFGLADGLAGVFVNSLVVTATGAGRRAAFVAATGAIRNLAKFLGPATVGLLILAIDLPTVFLVLATITAASVGLSVRLRPLDAALASVAPR